LSRSAHASAGERSEPTVAYIYHKNLKHNIGLIRTAVGNRKILAVVKGNAYGHGDLEVSRTAMEAGCDALGVAFFTEGARLRDNGIKAPILVFGAHSPELYQAAARKNLTMTITSPEQVAFLEKNPTESQLTVHIKIDTGMNRIGFSLRDVPRFFRQILKVKNIRIEGVYSHFASSDEQDLSYAYKQLGRFSEIIPQLKDLTKNDLVVHMANSGAIMQMPEAYFDMVRPGIMLYGYSPDPEYEIGWELKPVMSLHSRVGMIKLTPENEPVSYGRRYYTKTKTHLGIVPVGYADGFARANTNNAKVLIRNQAYPVVGTVCMDMIIVDLGSDLKCASGDEVIVYGGQTGEPTNIRQVARRLGTIPYEVTCSVSSRVPRIHCYE
jgi:alanine racemase